MLSLDFLTFQRTSNVLRSILRGRSDLMGRAKEWSKMRYLYMPIYYMLHIIRCLVLLSLIAAVLLMCCAVYTLYITVIPFHRTGQLVSLPLPKNFA